LNIQIFLLLGFPNSPFNWGVFLKTSPKLNWCDDSVSRYTQKDYQKDRKTKPRKGDVTVTPDNPLATEQGTKEEWWTDAMSYVGEDTKSLLSWRQGALPSQPAVERSKTLIRLTITQIPSGMEGLQPSVEQRMMEGLSASAMTLMGLMGLYPLNYFPEIEKTPPAEICDRTQRPWMAEKGMEHGPIEGEKSTYW
jgi:hypothetical protein